MAFPGAGKIARRFGITLACVLAARGCATEIETYARTMTAPKPTSIVSPERIAQSLVPYGTATDISPNVIDAAPSLERVLVEARYAP